ncbi:MAG TPA: glycosyltransferase, partial [Candidatus Hydrogenedentes bacterium]|nr:glycosyltransferase [Candidatus Hydrogenedentota bacterium]
VVSRLFNLPIHDVNCGFKLMRKDVVRHLRLYGEMHRLIPVYAHSLNFKVTEIPVEHHRRRYGKSKFGFERFTRGAIDVLTTWFLTRYRHQPAHFFAKVGFLKIAFAFLLCILGFWISQPLARLLLLVLAIALALGGALVVALGLFSEFVLYHFVRIDPALYIAENETRKK